MKIDDIEGDITAKGHESWIQILSFDFNIKRMLSLQPGRSADREGSRPTISEITLSKYLDQSSPILFSESCVGKAKSQIQLDICQTDDGTKAYTELTLYHAIISSYKLNANEQSGSIYPDETISISFDKIELRYTPYDNNNQAQSPITAAYDLASASMA